MCLIVFCNAVFSQSTSKICTLIRFTLFSNKCPYTLTNRQVLLPYRFTLFSNRSSLTVLSLRVLLPYRFTLFSNLWLKNSTPVAVLLPYRFTLFSNNSSALRLQKRFYYLIDLHYSQTLLPSLVMPTCFTTL